MWGGRGARLRVEGDKIEGGKRARLRVEGEMKPPFERVDTGDAVGSCSKGGSERKSRTFLFGHILTSSPACRGGGFLGLAA
ncbi:hypothetical protein BGLCM_1263 [Bifidobacterium gallicum DSM 20093 = LMG 11596]|uniref:Uncharacterized protein n=1 Tax=Bifidobacterium gallicum DSM 20093 = LMG 11596 TaxID=561180 RepID=A0A087AHR6_9BIFI|nr:hypothetical protein BGLCM_1263 [Bifidobacterium gallicum DSM 20093 = LMG 11596]